MSRLDLVTLIVREYDPAIQFFVNVLDFELAEDVPSTTTDGRPKRWVVIRPRGGGAGILLARADGDRQSAIAGDQFAGRVGLFLRVDDFDATYARLVAAGIEFVRPPRSEPYGRVAVFRDIEGNRWDLLGPRPVQRLTLEGPRIRLEPLSRMHHSALCEIGLDPGLWARTTIAVRTREEMASYIDAALEAESAGTALPFAIVERNTGKIIGTTRFHSIAAAHSRCEIGFTWIGRPWQRLGISSESKLVMLAHAFEHWRFQRVGFKADADNTPSCQALEAIGAVREGVLRQYMTSELRGQRDVAIFSILAPDWPVVRARLIARQPFGTGKPNTM